MLLLAAASPAPGQQIVPGDSSQGNVQHYQSSPQQNVVPSSNIPTPETYRQQMTASNAPQDQKMIQLLARKDYAGFQSEFAKHPTAGWAETLAWIYYREGKAALAQSWFSRALSLDSSDSSASYGLALIARDQGRISEATSQALRAPQDSKMRTLLQQIYAEQAGESYNRKEYEKCLALLAKMESLGPLTADQQTLRAWSHYQLGQYAESAREFEALYRVRQSKEIAEGLFYSLQRLNQRPRARLLADQLHGPLEQMVRDEQARDYYDRFLFLAAEAESPGLYAGLKNIDSSSLYAGAALRQKSGDKGLSRIDEDRLPLVGGSFVFSKVDQVTVFVSRTWLNSGALPFNAQVGTYPGTPRAYSYSPTTHLDTALVGATFIHQGWFSPYAEVGTTPIGGPVSVLPTGRLGFVQQTDSGNWGLSLFAKSNTESILAYTGIRDPYNGGHFGRVIESGLTASGYQDLGSHWGFSGEGTVSALTGEEVQTNEKAAVSAGIGKDLRIEGFQYFVLGPGFFGEHFERNLSGFTVGQGGYFSPDYLAQGTMDLNFLTLEGQPYIVRARFGVGGQTNRQGGSQLFPLSPDGRSNEATTQASYVLSSEVEGVVRLDDHWQFGGAFSYDQTATYNEAKEMLFFRFLFEPRPAVFSSDLMNWP